jgi:hypothetical protein
MLFTDIAEPQHVDAATAKKSHAAPTHILILTYCKIQKWKIFYAASVPAAKMVRLRLRNAPVYTYRCI